MVVYVLMPQLLNLSLTFLKVVNHNYLSFFSKAVQYMLVGEGKQAQKEGSRRVDRREKPHGGVRASG